MYDPVMSALKRERDAALKRAEAAEAEVARLKALLEAGKRPEWCRTVDATNHPAGDVVKPPEPYTPRVGDVVTFWSGCVGRIAWQRKCGPGWHIVNESTGGWWEVYNDHELRPATPAERAAAGLPPEAPAKPEVLPEHLACVEAWARNTASDYCEPVNGKMYDMVAARALLAAVARRDGGGK